MNRSCYKTGMLVRHLGKPEWGIGQIVGVQEETVDVCFRAAKHPKRIHRSVVTLEIVDAPAVTGIPDELRSKWRFLPPAEDRRMPNEPSARAFDARELRLRRSSRHGGVIKVESEDFWGTCDRCEGEGQTLYLVDDVDTGDLLQMGEACRRQALDSKDA